jgi:sensor histidine kinase YesM
LPGSNDHNPLFPKPWVYHSLFWIAYYIFGALISLSIHRIYDPRFYWQLLTLVPPDMILVYTHLFLLHQLLLKRRQIVLYIICILVFISLISLTNISLHRLYTRLGSPFFGASGDYNVRNFAAQVINSIYLLGLATAFKFGKDWMIQKQQLQEEEKMRIATELAFLRSQIQPHFFFNTLNNLYSLTLQRSDQAPEVVLKLSALMSYMLYESGAALVPLEKEIGNLQNYISLEQLRFGERLSLHFTASPGEGIQIPPLILLAFVENSFKHGVSRLTGNEHIDILLQTDARELRFEIDNPLPPHLPAIQGKNGIGLKNVIRRLDLLYGPRYRLDITEQDNRFHVTLKLPLA